MTQVKRNLKLLGAYQVAGLLLLALGSTNAAYAYCKNTGTHWGGISPNVIRTVATQSSTLNGPTPPMESVTLTFDCWFADANDIFTIPTGVQGDYLALHNQYEALYASLRHPKIDGENGNEGVRKSNHYWHVVMLYDGAEVAEWKLEEPNAPRIVRNNFRITSGMHTVTVRHLQTVIWSNKFSNLSLDQSFLLATMGKQNNGGSNNIRFHPIWSPRPNPCATAYKVAIDPPRINFGSRTVDNMNRSNVSVRRDFTVKAYIDAYFSRCQESATPEITMLADNTTHNTIDLGNGSEVAVTDLKDNSPMVFGTSYSLGRKIGSYPIGGTGNNQVERSYRLEWRKKAGETVTTASFSRAIRVIVDFK